MESWKRPSGDVDIARYIDGYWYLYKTDKDEGIAQPRMNPEPASHLILAPPMQRYSYELAGLEYCGSGSHLILPTTGTMALDHRDPFVLVGVKLRVGALYSLPLTWSANDVNQVRSEADCFAERLSLPAFFADGGNDELFQRQLCQQLDQQLKPIVLQAKEDRHSELVRAALPLLETQTIADVAERLDCVRRTLERSFLRVTGLTPKQYISMQTLEKLLVYLYQTEGPHNWAQLAIEFGFSDQPHLISYLKNAIDLTPGAYLKQRDLTVDIYGDFE